MYLKAKFRVNVILFLTERNRIDYIRDYCKKGAFNVIKTRYIPHVTDFYIIVSEILENLDNIYGEFNPYDTINAILYNPDFDIKNETFDTYLIKYIIIIAPFQLFEREKISQLTRTIIYRFRLQIINGIKFTIFKNYIKLLRQYNLNIRLTDKQFDYDHGFDNYETDYFIYLYLNKSSNKSNKRDKKR